MINRYPQFLDQVRCPADRDDPAYDGRIMHIAPAVQTNIHGVKFVWCTVRKADGKSQHVWPSHRLGYKIEG